ncbi:hypothetical protein PFISCL1PPCAC_14929, partial [Pristionchus fissidentatus]
MGRAMVPTYALSFILKVRWPFLLLNTHSIVVEIVTSIGALSMIILLLRHPQLRKYSIRRIRGFVGKPPRQSKVHSLIPNDGPIYFSMLAASW